MNFDLCTCIYPEFWCVCQKFFGFIQEFRCSAERVTCVCLLLSLFPPRKFRVGVKLKAQVFLGEGRAASFNVGLLLWIRTRQRWSKGHLQISFKTRMCWLSVKAAWAPWPWAGCASVCRRARIFCPLKDVTKFHRFLVCSGPACPAARRTQDSALCPRADYLKLCNGFASARKVCDNSRLHPKMALADLRALLGRHHVRSWCGAAPWCFAFIPDVHQH